MPTPETSPEPEPKLTPTEKLLLITIAAGRSVGKIISKNPDNEATIKADLASACAKLGEGAKTPYEAARIALEQGEILQDEINKRRIQVCLGRPPIDVVESRFKTLPPQMQRAAHAFASEESEDITPKKRLQGVVTRLGITVGNASGYGAKICNALQCGAGNIEDPIGDLRALQICKSAAYQEILENADASHRQWVPTKLEKEGKLEPTTSDTPTPSTEERGKGKKGHHSIGRF